MNASLTHLRGWSGELKVIENSLFQTLKEFEVINKSHVRVPALHMVTVVRQRYSH